MNWFNFNVMATTNMNMSLVESESLRQPVTTHQSLLRQSFVALNDNVRGTLQRCTRLAWLKQEKKNDLEKNPMKRRRMETLNGNLPLDIQGDEPEDDDLDVSGADEPTPEQRRAVMHLHKVTGHRSPLRLARALLLANAPYSVMKAAKQLKREVCQENRKVHARRPASLPRVRNFGDRIYVDLFSFRDHRDDTYWVAHAVDAATRFQAARLLDTKSSEEVGRFLVEGWFGTYGIPSAVTADMGPEFVSDHLQSLMDAHSDSPLPRCGGGPVGERYR